MLSRTGGKTKTLTGVAFTGKKSVAVTLAAGQWKLYASSQPVERDHLPRHEPELTRRHRRRDARQCGACARLVACCSPRAACSARRRAAAAAVAAARDDDPGHGSEDRRRRRLHGLGLLGARACGSTTSRTRAPSSPTRRTTSPTCSKVRAQFVTFFGGAIDETDRMVAQVQAAGVPTSRRARRCRRRCCASSAPSGRCSSRRRDGRAACRSRSRRRFTKQAQTLGAGFRIETTKLETVFDVLAQRYKEPRLAQAADADSSCRGSRRSPVVAPGRRAYPVGRHGRPLDRAVPRRVHDRDNGRHRRLPPRRPPRQQAHDRLGHLRLPLPRHRAARPT